MMHFFLVLLSTCRYKFILSTDNFINGCNPSLTAVANRRSVVAYLGLAALSQLDVWINETSSNTNHKCCKWNMEVPTRVKHECGESILSIFKPRVQNGDLKF